MKTYLLSHSSSGYGLFYAEGLNVICQNTEAIRNAVTDFNQFGKFVELSKLQPFDSAVEAHDEAIAISEGIMTDKLRNFLELNFQNSKEKEFYLGVHNSKLAASISDATKILCRSNEFVLEILRGVRLHFHKFIKAFKPGEFEQPQLGSSIRANVDSNANMVIQAIETLDTVDKDIESSSMRLKEFYGLHFPELVNIIDSNYLYAEVTKFIGNKSVLSEYSHLKEIVGDEDLAKRIFEAAKASMGLDLNPLDSINVQRLAQRVLNLFDLRRNLYDSLVTKMNDIAPNLTSLIGEMVGARLISHAGSLTNLAKCPSSKLQILGAEKAMFRALKTQGNTPKHGLIFDSSFIDRASSRNKGRMARYLANKCSTASRIDCFSEKGSKVFGEKLREQVEERLNFYENGVAPRKNADVMKDAIEVPQKDGDSYVKKTKYEVGEILHLAQLASVRIQVAQENSGSGTILLKSGAYCLILTCGHVIKPAILDVDYPIVILFADGHESDGFKPVSTKKQCDEDFGLLFGYDEKLTGMNVKTICTFSELEEAHEEIYCSSYPYAVDYPIGVVGRVSQHSCGKGIGYSLGLAYGSSGAAILNARGEILALHAESQKAPVLSDENIPKKIGTTAGVLKYGIYSSEIIEQLAKLCEECAQQKGGTECGYYVMWYMYVSKHNGCNGNLNKEYIGRLSADNEEEWNKVREQWA